MSMSVGGVGSPTWPDKAWPTSSADPVVQRVGSIQKSVDDERSLGALATGTARRTSSTAGLTQQDFEVATRLGPNGVAAKVDQVVAPKPDRNPWNAGADRAPVNPYDHIVDALRTSALKRDAALAGTSSTTAAGDRAAAGSPVTASATTETAKLAYAPMSSSQYGEAYVRDAIDAYQRNSGLSSGSSTSTAVALADAGTDAAADPALAASDAPTPAPPADREEVLL